MLLLSYMLVVFFSKLQHSNIVRLLGIAYDGSVGLISEFMSFGSLESWLRSRGRHEIKQTDQRKVSL